MRLILSIVISGFFFAGSFAQADTSPVNRNEGKVCCDRPDHSCKDANGYPLTPCPAVAVGAASVGKGVATFTEGAKAVEGDKATAVPANSK